MEETASLVAPEAVEYSFEFRGNSGEFFKIWAVNVLLTVITLGFFSAWAKVRTKRYFNGNTFLDGGNFDYHANPWSILIARIVIFGTIGLVAYWAGEDLLKKATHSTLLVLFLPWAYVRGLAFNARNTSFKNLRFSFSKTYGVVYIAYLPIIVAVLAPTYYAANYLGSYPDNEILETLAFDILKIQGIFWGGVLLFFPLMIRALHRFRACGHSFGDLPFDFRTPSVWRYYAVLGVIVAVVVAILSMFLILTAIFYDGSEWSRFIYIKTVLPSLFPAIVLFIYFAVIVAIFLMGALYFRLFWNNLFFPNGEFQCNIPVFQFTFKILIVNYLAIGFSLGCLYPWAKIRRVRYLAEHIKIIAPAGALQRAIAARKEKEGAMGEELSTVEGFDFDIGLI